MKDKLFGIRVTGSEHALLHAAAKAEGEDSASAWARDLLMERAREAFRATLRPSQPPREGDPDTRPRERGEVAA